MSEKAFADAPQTSTAVTPATQPADPAEKNAAATAKADGKLFGTKPGESPLGTRNNAGPDTSALLRQMLALVVVIVGLGVACWLVLKKGLPRLRIPGQARPKEIVVLETTYLPCRQSLYLLQVGSKKLLLSGSKEGVEMLADVTDGFPEQPTDEQFQDVLSKKDLRGSEGNA